MFPEKLYFKNSSLWHFKSHFDLKHLWKSTIIWRNNWYYIIWLSRRTRLICLRCWYKELQNREKSLTLIWQRFSCLRDEWIAKISKKNFSRWLFEIIHIIRFEMHMDRRINLKIFLGYDINYLSIWPFMGHPWFPTRKGLKTNICLFSPCWVMTMWLFPACWVMSFPSKLKTGKC